MYWNESQQSLIQQLRLVILRVTKLKPAFLGCFCYWLNSFMKGYEGGIFSKAPELKTLFLLKMKIEQKLEAAQIKNNAVFKHFQM